MNIKQKLSLVTQNLSDEQLGPLLELAVKLQNIAIPIVVRYRVLGFEESGVRIRDSGVKILVYLMRLGNAITTQIHLWTGVIRDGTLI
ncbi:MAG: hypothetical protein EWV67_13650 [Microcystis sp. M_QC_C_20170808_M2Col]|uniref:hypothetical protein n=1 Tax=Microcystis sp. M_QC_C_20170808_M2Col TaxID=2486215 RepID=UPI001191FBE3|nr:hypothetical protein [Microcystis sp. M_QC_C_20170808_M2Col]TRT62599.1 MAG: hypothetical protein EWV67_13650 [Microcystis sp. M_QC_C_20170808_M2Col]